MARPLSEILAESFDTGDPRAKHAKFYIRKINKQFYGRFKYNTALRTFKRVGGKYPDKNAALQAAKISAL